MLTKCQRLTKHKQLAG